MIQVVLAEQVPSQVDAHRFASFYFDVDWLLCVLIYHPSSSVVLHFVHLAIMELDRIDCTSTLTTIPFSIEVLAIVTYMTEYLECRKISEWLV